MSGHWSDSDQFPNPGRLSLTALSLSKVTAHATRHTHPHSHILISPSRLFCLVDDGDDNNETFKVQQQEFAPFVLSPLHKQYRVYNVVGACHGLVCMFGSHYGYHKEMLLIWNPSIGRSFGIVVPRYHHYDYIYGFGVCPVTKDPTVLKMKHTRSMPWHVEVFTLSSRVWNVIPTTNFPHESIRLYYKDHVVIDRFIYWSAFEETMTIDDDGEAIRNPTLLSFDLITKEFKVVDLPVSLTNELTYGYVSVSKLRESLVVYGSINAAGADCCGVWLMERDSSFRKLFSVGSQRNKMVGFSNNGEAVLEIRKAGGLFTTFDVYDPCSQQIKNLGISFGGNHSSFMDSYKESLLLLEHSGSHIF